MAESMIRSEDRREGETMMDVGESYLGELARRCMVQVQLEEEELEFRKYKSCRLHDLMRDMCLDKAKEEDFFKSFDQKVAESSSSSFSSTGKIRRVVIYYDGKNRDVPPFPKETSQHIRSLLLVNKSWRYEGRMPRIVKSYLGHFKLLRVLVIEGINSELLQFYFPRSLIHTAFHIPLEFYMLPKAVGNLIHLRYLSLWRSSFLMFPSSISNLKHLQTLDLRGDFVFYQPCVSYVLQKMGQLRHLYLPESWRYEDSNNVKATNLRLNGLRNLETLENFNPIWCDTKDLIKLTNLRKVTIEVEKQHGELERIIEWLITANHLRHSSLDINDCDMWKAEGILGRLFQCGSLHHLYITGSIGNHHLSFTPSLTLLYLWECEIEEDPMPTLENLPNLRKLHLRNDAYKRKEMVCSAIGFPQLKSLSLDSLNYLEKWRVDEGAMPNLLRLTISRCEKFEMVPDGLRFVTSLRELLIGYMTEEFKKRVRVVNGEEGEDFHKIRHVPSISIIEN